MTAEEDPFAPDVAMLRMTHFGSSGFQIDPAHHDMTGALDYEHPFLHGQLFWMSRKRGKT